MICSGKNELDFCAHAVILTVYYKVKDNLHDGGVKSKILAAMIYPIISLMRKKAIHLAPEIDEIIKKLMEEYGLTQEKVSERLGKSRSAIANTLRILTLYPEVLELVEKGKISFGHAKILASITEYSAQLILAKKIAKDKLTVRDLEKEVDAILGNKKRKKVAKLPSEELQEFISRFSANASKSKQATSRKRALEKIELEDIRPSSRKYPYIDFKIEKPAGKEILKVENLLREGTFKNTKKILLQELEKANNAQI